MNLKIKIPPDPAPGATPVGIEGFWSLTLGGALKMMQGVFLLNAERNEGRIVSDELLATDLSAAAQRVSGSLERILKARQEASEHLGLNEESIAPYSEYVAKNPDGLVSKFYQDLIKTHELSHSVTGTRADIVDEQIGHILTAAAYNAKVFLSDPHQYATEITESLEYAEYRHPPLSPTPRLGTGRKKLGR